MGIYFEGSQILFDSDKIAMDVACCCGGKSCGLCEGLNTPLYLTGTITGFTGICDFLNGIYVMQQDTVYPCIWWYCVGGASKEWCRVNLSYVSSTENNINVGRTRGPTCYVSYPSVCGAVGNKVVDNPWDCMNANETIEIFSYYGGQTGYMQLVAGEP